MKFINKIRGDSAALPPCPAFKVIALAFAGAFLAIATLTVLSHSLDIMLILGSFGASCVIIFGYPDVPFSQPRNIVFGHLIGICIGLIFMQTCGARWWSVALAVAVAIALMMLTRTVHPPAGSNPVIVFLLQPDWSYIVFPTLTGALLLVLVALLFHNITRNSRWPKYW